MALPGQGTGRRWVTLGTGTLAMFLLGAIYAYGVLLPALMRAYGWERSTAAIPQSVLLFVYAVGMSIGGALQDRTSPRGIAIIGGIGFGLGVLLASYTHGLATLVLSYGLLGGIGFGFVYVAAVTATMKSFPDRRGLAAGVVVGAFGLGTFVWAPLAQGLLTEVGWQGVLFRYGLLAVVLLPLLALGIRSPWMPHDIPGEHLASQGVSPGFALRTGLFWVVFAAYVLVTSVGLMLLAHYVNFGIARGIAPLQAALILSVTSVGSGAGRVIMGWLSDRIGRFPSLIASTVLEIAALAALVIGVSSGWLFTVAGLTGFAFGTWLSLYGPTATDLFGLRHAGTIYGFLYLSYGIGGLVGPTVGGLLADASGGYRLPFAIGAVLCAVAVALFAVAMRMQPPAYTHPPALEDEFPV